MVAGPACRDGSHPGPGAHRSQGPPARSGAAVRCRADGHGRWLLRRRRHGGVFAVWLSSGSPHGQPWVVAARDLPVGARLAASDLTTESLSLPSAGVGALAFGSPAPLVGEVLAAPLRAGELVQTGDLTIAAGPSGLRPVTVAVAPSDLADIDPGSTVDVLVTDGTDPSSPTLVVVGGGAGPLTRPPTATLTGGLGTSGPS